MQVIPKQRKPPMRMNMDPFGAFSPLGMGMGMGMYPPPGQSFGGRERGRGRGRGGRGQGRRVDMGGQGRGDGMGGRGQYQDQSPRHADVWIRGIHELDFSGDAAVGSMVN